MSTNTDEPVNGADEKAAEAGKADESKDPAKGRFHPLTWVPTLYTAESLPFNAVILVSVMMYKSLGLSDSWIALWTGWLLLPWTLKPFFSPFLEMFGNKKLFVLATQVIAGAGFGVMAFALPLPFRVQATLAIFFIMAFNSAIHDTAADGLYIDSLSKTNQAKFIGFQSAFWNIGQVVAQGGLTYVAGKLEEKYDIVPAWMVVWGIFGVLMILFAVYHSLVAPRGRAAATEGGSFIEVARSFKVISIDYFLKKHIWWLIAFALIYRTAEGQIEKIAQLFMRAKLVEGGLEMSTAEVGLVYGTAGTIGMVIGSIVGGWYASKVGLRRAIIPLALIFNIPNALFTFLAFTQINNLWIVSVCATVEKFSLGMGFVAMTLVLMQQMAPGRFSTAHYGYATALMGAGMMVPSMTSGFVSDAIGYQAFFVYIIIMGIPSIVIAIIVRGLVRENIPLVEIPEGPKGEIVRSGTWATALAAGGLYLWLTCGFGLVLEGKYYLTKIIIFGVETLLGVLLAGAAIKASLKAGSLLAKHKQEVANQRLLPMVLAIAGIITWLGCFGWLINGNMQMDAARADCSDKSEAGACEQVCSNDATYAACTVAAEAKYAEVKPILGKPAPKCEPTDEACGEQMMKELDDAQGALGLVGMKLEIGCFTEQKTEECIAFGDLKRDPSEWRRAEAHADLDEAKRFYTKACVLEKKAGAEGKGCQLVDEVTKEIEAEKAKKK